MSCKETAAGDRRGRTDELIEEAKMGGKTTNEEEYKPYLSEPRKIYSCLFPDSLKKFGRWQST
jgi:hypothetical protein